MYVAWSLLPLFVLTVASCGARDPLGADALGGTAGGSSTSTSTSISTSTSGSSTSGAGGTGGTSGTTSVSVTTGSTGSGGTGGTMSTGGTGGTGGTPVVACDSVVVATPVVTLEDAAGDLSQPSLVAQSPGAPTAALIASRQALPPTTGPTARVGAFDAWGAWPPAIDVLTDIKKPESSALVPGVALLAASRTETTTPAFAMLYENFGSITTSIAFKVLINGTSFATVDSLGGQPLSLTESPAIKQLFGTLRAPDGVNFSLNVMIAAATVEHNYFTLGCASTPIAADAAAAPDGWLFAASLGTPLAWNSDGSLCQQKFGTIGPATALHLMHVLADGSAHDLTQVVSLAAPIRRIRMAARPGHDGGWIIWSLQGAAGLAGARLTALPAIVQPFQISALSAPSTLDSFDVEPLGDLLVVAAASQGLGAQDHIRVVAIDLNGAAHWSATIVTDGALVDGSLSLLAAPDGSATLVAWSEKAAGATSRRLRVARLDCVPPSP